MLVTAFDEKLNGTVINAFLLPAEIAAGDFI
jgi:hypothetical protein